MNEIAHALKNYKNFGIYNLPQVLTWGGLQ